MKDIVKWKLQFRNSLFDLKWKIEFKKASFIFQFWLINKKVKNEKKKNFFKIYFDLKPVSKNKVQNFRIHFLIWNQKMNFKKLFPFSVLVMKLKKEKWKSFKIRFIFKSKNELSFRYMDSFNFSRLKHFLFLYRI